MRTRLAYKLFSIGSTNRNLIFKPWFHEAREKLEPYNIKYIIQRPNNCGPFACFRTIRSALRLDPNGIDFKALYLVRILPSKDKKLWLNGDTYSYHLPQGTILADEFEVIKRVTSKKEQL